MAKKRLHSVYITKGLYEIIYYLMEREEITKIVFVSRAIRYFMAEKRILDYQTLIRKKSDPDYIKRDKQFVFHIDPELKQQVLDFAEQYNETHVEQCNPSQCFFQILVEYCAYLIQARPDGIVDNK